MDSLDFKEHPYFDTSPASDWIDVRENVETITPEMEPFARFIRAFEERREQIERKVLERIRHHAADDLRERPHALRNEVCLAPLGTDGFKVYVEFYFQAHVHEPSADTDLWWGIIFCSLDPRFGLADVKYWNVVHLGWSVR